MTDLAPVRPALVDVPQRWGILPTRWFWQEEISPKLRRALQLFFFAQGLAVGLVLVFGGLGLESWQRWLIVLLGGALGTLQVGAAERVLRRHIKARRRRYELADGRTQR